MTNFVSQLRADLQLASCQLDQRRRTHLKTTQAFMVTLQTLETSHNKSKLITFGTNTHLDC